MSVCWAPTSHETRPDTVVKTPCDPINFDSSKFQFANDFFSNLSTTLIWILVLVVMCWEAIEVVNDIHLLGDIYLKLVRATLPVRREDNDGLGFDFCSNLLSDTGQLGIGRVFCILDEIGAADTEEVDGRPVGH